LALEPLFQRELTAPVVALPALDASRYRTPRPGDLTVVISVSGEVSRGIELARTARAAGAVVVAVTAFADSTLARNSNGVLAIPQPLDRSIPHARDYTVTMLALVCLLEKIAGRVYEQIDSVPDLVGEAVPTALATAEGLATTDGTRTWFLGAGPDRGTAMYGAMKYWEAAGLEAWWDDLEEFGHGSQLMARPGDRATLIAAGPGCGRALEMIPGFELMGLEPILVGPAALTSGNCTHFQTPEFDPLWHPFVAAVPLQALTCVEANRRQLDVSVVLDGQQHGPIWDLVHTEWTKHSAIVAPGPPD
jgi:fructoselysine-6-P-deglycase FrlB-like protein